MAKLLSMCVGTDPAALWIYSFWIFAFVSKIKGKNLTLKSSDLECKLQMVKSFS